MKRDSIDVWLKCQTSRCLTSILSGPYDGSMKGESVNLWLIQQLPSKQRKRSGTTEK